MPEPIYETAPGNLRRLVAAWRERTARQARRRQLLAAVSVAVLLPLAFALLGKGGNALVAGDAGAERTVTLLVARTRVPRHTILREPGKFFELRQQSKGAPPSYFTDLAQVEGKRLRRELPPGVPLLPEHLQTRSDPLWDIMPPGHGAVGLRVPRATGETVWPGDRVDILWTRRGSEASPQTIMRAVLVVETDEDDERPTATICLCLTPDDALRVRRAEELGGVSLRLRRDGNDATEPTRGGR